MILLNRMNKIPLVWHWLAVVFVTGCGTCSIHSKETGQSAGPTREAALFWATSANDSSIPVERRRTCIMKLFREYIRPGMMLGEVAECLNKPKWLHDEEIWPSGTGSLSVKVVPGDSIFCICVAPDGLASGGKESVAYVYMRVAGYMNLLDFSRAIRGQAIDKQIRDRKLEEIGFFEH